MRRGEKWKMKRRREEDGERERKEEGKRGKGWGRKIDDWKRKGRREGREEDNIRYNI